MRYKVSYSEASGYLEEIKEYTKIFTDLDEATLYAKSLLFTKLKEPDWQTDTQPAFIDEVCVESEEQKKCNPDHPNSAFEPIYSCSYSIWDDEFYQKPRIEHVHDLHRVLFANYYEDGRNDPLEYVLKCGYNHQILDVYWMHVSEHQDFILVSAMAETYDWEHGWQDWDETKVHVYSVHDPRIKMFLRDIRSEIA